MATVLFLMFLSSFRELNPYYLVNVPKNGGIYSEGSVGKFLRINPIYSQTNPRDEDAVNLIFSGLVKRGENGSIVGDLADNWKIRDENKTFIFELKSGVRWHDGAEFTADDVLFTLSLIQNPDVRSPLYETWKGVKAEKTPEGWVKFTLEHPNNSFLENAAFKIVPKHILESVPMSSIQTVEFNVKPIGTGPYKFESLTKEADKETLILSANSRYYAGEPHIQNIILEGFSSEVDAVDAYRKRQIKAISSPSVLVADKFDDDIATNIHEYHLPRYVAAFFNTGRETLKDKNLRIALALTVDRNRILNQAVSEKGSINFYPITSGAEGFSTNVPKYSKDVGKAKAILKKGGYTLDGGVLKYKGKEVTLKVVTGDTPELGKTAEIFASGLREVGVKVEVENVDSVSLERDYIRPRDYDVLIFGEDLGMSSDLFSFWHSTQVDDPGLNFSRFKDRELDKFLEMARVMGSGREKADKLQGIQRIIVDNAAAVYLYNPYYFLVASDKVGGVDEGRIVTPSDRFHNVKDWFVNSTQVVSDDRQ